MSGSDLLDLCLERRFTHAYFILLKKTLANVTGRTSDNYPIRARLVGLSRQKMPHRTPRPTALLHYDRARYKTRDVKASYPLHLQSAIEREGIDMSVVAE
jgi:hypothetical protein